MIMYQVEFRTEQPVVARAAADANGKYHHSTLRGIELVMRQRAGCEM